jgi:hypothetical protein
METGKSKYNEYIDIVNALYKSGYRDSGGPYDGE